MTRAHFLSIVGLRLRAIGAQPPSELCLFSTEMMQLIFAKKKTLSHPSLQLDGQTRVAGWSISSSWRPIGYPVNMLWEVLLWQVELKSWSHFAIWPHESQGQKRARSTSGHIRSNFRIGIFALKCVFLNQFDLSIPKMSFYFSVRSRNAQNFSFKNEVMNIYGFLVICLQKINISN